MLLGIIIFTTEQANALEIGLQLLLNVVGVTTFGGTHAPQNIMSDNSAAKRKALKNVFPNANLFLYIFHVLQAFWRYLWNNENIVLKNDKNLVFQMFKRILYSSTETDYSANYEVFMRHEVTAKYPKVLKYVLDMEKEKKSWVLCYHQNTTIRDNNTNNYCEVTMRVFKENFS